jgi:RNA polymerase-binding protein DksA
MSKHGALRKTLQDRLETLVNRVGRIERDLRQPHDDDWQERATEVENDEVLEGLDEISRTEALSIRAALRRMDEGKYGFCASCGKPIGEERLAAMPTAATCIWCAR